MGVKTRKLGNANNSFVEWQSVVTASTLNAVAGRGYFINTTSNICTVTLPTPKVGDVIRLKDYARTWNTNKVALASATMDGATATTEFTTQGQTVSIVYMDDTKGWSVINEDTTSKLEIPATFIAATGGTVATSGDFKIHTFTGDSNFVVSSIGNNSANPTGGPTGASYIVVAGGGGGGADRGGGGGAGGFREGRVSSPEYTASPLATTGLTLAVQTYPITVGGGGAGGAHPGPTGSSGVNGSNSVFSTITSAGGGRGKNSNTGFAAAGGSGGGGSGSGAGAGGAGNTPPVSPSQGFPGGTSSDTSNPRGAGGGGATAASAPSVPLPAGIGAGGAGATTNITGSPVAYAGGGGGAGQPNLTSAGGAGGGGNAVTSTAGSAGTANTGGGGGGACTADGGAGGKGIVIIRYKFQ